MNPSGGTDAVERSPAIPSGNLSPNQLAQFIFDDFRVAWNSMAAASPDPRVGGNLMFARQSFAYLELASRTASSHDSDWYLESFSTRLADCDERYFTALPGPVPLPRPDEFRLPALGQRPRELQLLAALFDTARNGLAHLSQQIPVRLTDGKIWMASFAGVCPGAFMDEVLASERRDGHLSFTVSDNGHVYLLVRPDVLLADLRFSARLAGLFSQYLAPEYLQRPRLPGRRARSGFVRPPEPYQFSSDELIASLQAGGHERRPWSSQ